VSHHAMDVFGVLFLYVIAVVLLLALLWGGV
jgi:hypothetical protein